MPAYWRMVHSRPRYIVACTPRVKGYSPGISNFAFVIRAFEIGRRVQGIYRDMGRSFNFRCQPPRRSFDHVRHDYRFVQTPKSLSFRSAIYLCHSEARSALVIPKRAAQRNLLSPAAPLTQSHHRAPPLPFCLTLQNELTPNHANVTVKQTATTTRPTPTRPASYFAYSFAVANPPLAAITRKISPVTSSHN